MKILKLFLSLISVICLAIIAIYKNPIAGIVLLSVTSLTIGIMIGEGASKNGK
ncbi:MAG: hypothetical protein IJB96_04500 [Lachnospira sp.]|nr:hypothetical protein [Lachnospira sp.]